MKPFEGGLLVVGIPAETARMLEAIAKAKQISVADALSFCIAQSFTTEVRVEDARSDARSMEGVGDGLRQPHKPEPLGREGIREPRTRMVFKK
jgi:hypothetical protein